MKIGMGIAIVSVLSMGAVIPVFADVHPSSIETTGPAIYINAETTAAETTAATTTASETVKEDSETGKKVEIDYDKSPNFCKCYHDDKTIEEKEPEVKPSDYKDPTIRKFAEEYVKKGYFINDAKFAATHYGSGMGIDVDHCFCNGFTAVNDNKGNNTECIFVLKATPEEFYAMIPESNCVKKGNVSTYTEKTSCSERVITYDETTQVFVAAAKFTLKGVG